MEKLKFFKGLFFGLIMSLFMWAGIFWTLIKLDTATFQPEISNVKEPVAANFTLASLE